jgi:hypothetical protein
MNNRHKYYRDSLSYLKEAEQSISDYKISNEDIYYLNHATKHLCYSLEFLIKYILIMLKAPFDYNNKDKDGHNIEQLRQALVEHPDFYELLDCDEQFKRYSGMITGWKSKNFYSEFNTKISLNTITEVIKIINNILDSWDKYRNVHPEVVIYEDNYKGK